MNTINYWLYFIISELVILSNLQNVGSDMKKKFIVENKYLLKINFVEIIFLYLLTERMFG